MMIERHWITWLFFAAVPFGIAAILWFPTVAPKLISLDTALIVVSFLPAAIIWFGRPDPSALALSTAEATKSVFSDRSLSIADTFRAALLALATTALAYMISYPTGSMEAKAKKVSIYIQHELQLALILAMTSIALVLVSSIHQRVKSRIRAEAEMANKLADAEAIRWPTNGWLSRRRLRMAIRNSTIDELAVVALFAAGLLYIKSLTLA